MLRCSSNLTLLKTPCVIKVRPCNSCVRMSAPEQPLPQIQSLSCDNVTSSALPLWSRPTQCASN